MNMKQFFKQGPLRHFNYSFNLFFNSHACMCFFNWYDFRKRQWYGMVCREMSRTCSPHIWRRLFVTFLVEISNHEIDIRHRQGLFTLTHIISDCFDGQAKNKLKTKITVISMRRIGWNQHSFCFLLKSWNQFADLYVRNFERSEKSNQVILHFTMYIHCGIIRKNNHLI